MKLGKQKVFIPIKEIELDSSSPLSVIQGDCSYHFKCYVKEQQGYFLTEDKLDEYAKQEAIEFLKWYALKLIAFAEYVKNVKPIVTSDEIEEKLSEFEGKEIKDVHELYLQSKITNNEC